MMGFYDDIVSDAVAPPWLQQGAYQQGSGVGGRILQTCGKELDQIATRARQAAVVSMPGVGDPSAIPLLCADRLIVQGSSETTGQITARLTGAITRPPRRCVLHRPALPRAAGYASPCSQPGSPI